MAVDTAELRTQLQDFAVTHYEKDAQVSQVEVMPGHSGLSFGFRVDYYESGQDRHESLVMRLPPKGVRQSGNTDVLRQVPLLQTLKRNGVPVPNVRWSGDDLRCRILWSSGCRAGRLMSGSQMPRLTRVRQQLPVCIIRQLMRWSRSIGLTGKPTWLVGKSHVPWIPRSASGIIFWPRPPSPSGSLRDKKSEICCYPPNLKIRLWASFMATFRARTFCLMEHA